MSLLLLLAFAVTIHAYHIDLSRPASRDHFTLQRNAQWKCVGGDACYADQNLTEMVCFRSGNRTHCASDVEGMARLDALTIECDAMPGAPSVFESGACRAQYRLHKLALHELFLLVLLRGFLPLVGCVVAIIFFPFWILPALCGFRLAWSHTAFHTEAVMTLVQPATSLLTVVRTVVVGLVAMCLTYKLTALLLASGRAWIGPLGRRKRRECQTVEMARAFVEAEELFRTLPGIVRDSVCKAISDMEGVE
jgi:hypothetical protein